MKKCLVLVVVAAVAAGTSVLLAEEEGAGAAVLQAPLVKEGDRPEKPKPRKKEGERVKEKAGKRTRLSGEISAVEGTTLTIGQKGDEGEKTQAVNIQDAKIMLTTDQDEEVAEEGGKTRKRPLIVTGSAEDLIVGKRVSVVLTEGKPAEITVLRAEERRKGGEGKKDGSAPGKPPKKTEKEQ